LVNAFTTLTCLVDPPFINSKPLSLCSIFIFLSTTTVNFLKFCFKMKSILCSKSVLLFNFDKSLLSFFENLVLLPAAKSIK